MNQFKAELSDVLAKIRKSKVFKFAVGGVSTQLPSLPGISIPDYGMVPLPLMETAVKDLKQHFSQAPYGLGEETLIDKNVRDSWQLDPEKFDIRNQTFNDEVEKLVKNVQFQIDCSGQNVTSRLYKLLLYQPGGHFKPHRDTEKFPGMFATLIIQLPSIFTGGDFIVKHGKSEKKIEFSVPESQFSCMYAAHYADCEHELTEITSGYRLALVYSLCWDGNGITPSLPPPDILTNKLVELLGQMDKKLPEPHMIGWALDHQYSENSFLGMGVKALKGGDYHVYSVLEAANSMLKDDKQLDFLIIEAKKLDIVYGWCTRERDSEWDSDDSYVEDNYEEESYDEDIHGDCFDAGDGYTEYEMTAITVDGDEEMYFDFDGHLEAKGITKIVLNEPKDDNDEKFWGECHKGKCTGPSGNEGSTKTNWYQRYVLLIFPEYTFKTSEEYASIHSEMMRLLLP